MGVMTCMRGDCEHIMCDRYSSQYGYLCDDCFDELVRIGPGADIEWYMDGSLVESFSIDASRAFFNEIFESQTEGYPDGQ